MKTLEHNLVGINGPLSHGAFVCGVFIGLPRNCIMRHDLWRISSATWISGGRQSVNDRNQYKSVYWQLTYTHLSTIYTLSNYLYITTGKTYEYTKCIWCAANSLKSWEAPCCVWFRFGSVFNQSNFDALNRFICTVVFIRFETRCRCS